LLWLALFRTHISHFSCAQVSTFSVLRFTHTPGVTYTRQEGNHSEETIECVANTVFSNLLCLHSAPAYLVLFDFPF